MLLRRYSLSFILAAIFLFYPSFTQVGYTENRINESVYETMKKEPAENSQQAETENTIDKNEDENISVTAFDFIKMFFALIFVLLLVYLLLRFVTKRNKLFQQGQSIANLGGTSLGQNKSIQVIKVGSRVLVVGVGDSISLLKEIDDEKEKEQVLDEFYRKQEQVVEAKDLFQRLLVFVNRNKKNTMNNDNNRVFRKAFYEQLERLKSERHEMLEDIKRKGIDKHE